jgi:hypothetical protein
MKTFFSLVAALVITLAPAFTLAQDSIRKVRVNFPRGADSTTIQGTLKGRQIIDYVLGAAAGQRMTVTLTTDNAANSFNLIVPGAGDVAFFVGSTAGNRYDGELARSGALKASKRSDLNIIRIGRERYEIPDAVIFGG